MTSPRPHSLMFEPHFYLGFHGPCQGDTRTDAIPGNMPCLFSPGAWSELSAPSPRLCHQGLSPPVHTLGDFWDYKFLFYCSPGPLEGRTRIQSISQMKLNPGFSSVQPAYIQVPVDF